MPKNNYQSARRKFLSASATILAGATAAVTLPESGAAPDPHRSANQSKSRTNSRAASSATKTLIMGVVTGGHLAPFDNPGERLRLTQLSAVAAMSPEAREIQISEHEGKVLMVLGLKQGTNWVYSAKILDVVGLALGFMAWQTLRDQNIERYLT